MSIRKAWQDDTAFQFDRRSMFGELGKDCLIIANSQNVTRSIANADATGRVGSRV
jgi:hypothetical protein